MKTYIERQNECGLKVGDKVKVVRTAISEENGWDNSWVDDMDKAVGQEGVIEDISEDGIQLTINGDCYEYPYFVLEKVGAEANPMVAFLEDLAAILKKHDASLCYSDYHCEICARTNSNMGVMFLGEAIAHDSKKLNNLIKDLK